MRYRVPPLEPPGPDLLTVYASVGRSGPHRLQLVGELCAYTAPLLAAHLEADVALSAADVILDTSGVTFVDSAGISRCLALRERWRLRGRSLVVADPSEAMCRVVRLLALEDLVFAPTPVDPPAGPPTDRAADQPAAAAAAPTVEVRNLDRGQTIEVQVSGVVAGPGLDSLARRLELLATKRQPATLRLDLADAVVDLTAAEPIVRVAASLEEFGSQLVVLGGSPTLEGAVPPEQRGRSLTFAHGGDGGGAAGRRPRPS